MGTVIANISDLNPGYFSLKVTKRIRGKCEMCGTEFDEEFSTSSLHDYECPCGYFSIDPISETVIFDNHNVPQEKWKERLRKNLENKEKDFFLTQGTRSEYEAELREELRENGLPENIQDIIGKKYSFVCEHGSHYQVLVGTVEALELSDEGGLQLFVSNPTIWGEPLKSFIFSDGKVEAIMEVNPKEISPSMISAGTTDEQLEMMLRTREYLEGKFTLLPY